MDLRDEHGRSFCTRCGRMLPIGRNQLCYVCRPKRDNDKKEAAYRRQRKPYTYLDRAAQADARGISYGQLMWFVENNMELPPLKRSVVWPMSSQHHGEEQLEA